MVKPITRGTTATFTAVERTRLLESLEILSISFSTSRINRAMIAISARDEPRPIKAAEELVADTTVETVDVVTVEIMQFFTNSINLTTR